MATLSTRRHFTAYTDHESITKLLTQPHLSGRQAHWVELLADFDIKIEYRLGAGNIVADALSCRPDHHTLAALRDALSPTPSTILFALTTIQSTLMDDIIQAAKDDVEYQDHCNQLNSSSHDDSTFSFQHGLLVRGDAIYIPASPTLR
jgi:hypothetical protein